MLGDFTVKKTVKLGREICISLKIDEEDTKCCVWLIITIICVTNCAKGFFETNFLIKIKQLLTKYQIFTKLPQISHTH